MTTLNIKDPTAHTLAQALAKATGETMTCAVTEAIRERLERIRRQRKRDTTVTDLLTIGRRCAGFLKNAPVNHDMLFCDERGLTQ